MGDLNTMAHRRAARCDLRSVPASEVPVNRARSVARLSPLYCCDKFRWASLGSSEARFWATNLFDVMAKGDEHDAADQAAVPASDADAAAAAAQPAEEAAPAAAGQLRVPRGGANPRLAAWGLPAALCTAAVNPGFRDPFCPDADVTLNNPTYWGLMQGKLDWLLLRRLRAAAAQAERTRMRRATARASRRRRGAGGCRGAP